MKTKQLLGFILGIILIATICLCVFLKIKNKTEYSSYSLKEAVVTAINSTVNHNSCLVSREGHPFIVKQIKDSFVIVDVELDSVSRVLVSPISIRRVNSFYCDDTSHFALLTDTFFLVYNKGVFRKYDLSRFNDKQLPVKYGNIVYFPELNLITAVVIPLEYDKNKQAEFDLPFLNFYYLDKDKSVLYPFNYPKQYHGGNLGTPRSVFSRSDSLLLISFEYDDSIYQINVRSKVLSTLQMKSDLSELKIKFPTNGSKKEKLDAMHTIIINNDSYGPAIFNNETKDYYRIYKPSLPLKASNGKYFSTTDKGCIVLRYNIETGKKFQYKLANGMYFVSADWSLDVTNNSLLYNKILPLDAKQKVWQYIAHRITLYDF